MVRSRIEKYGIVHCRTELYRVVQSCAKLHGLVQTCKEFARSGTLSYRVLRSVK